jgi:DNA-binding CsgD family transcriptional regulator
MNSELTLKWLLQHLTQTERIVLALLSLGLSTAEIAERAGVSESTTYSHRDSLREKLGLKGAGYGSLVALAVSHRELLSVFLPPEKTPRK